MHRMIALIIGLAAPPAAAQVLVEQPGAEIELAPAQISYLSVFIQSLWPDITPAKTQRFTCSRRAMLQCADGDCEPETRAKCHALAYATYTPAEYVAASPASGIPLPTPDDIAEDGNVTLLVRYGPVYTSAAQTAQLAQAAANAFATPVGSMQRLVFGKRGSTYWGRVYTRATVSPEAALAGVRGGIYSRVLHR